MNHTVTFNLENKIATVAVPTNTLLSDAALQAGIDIGQPCGGQGRCGRCAVQVMDGEVRRRSTLRLSPSDVEAGYALACQTVIEGDAVIYIPPQEKIERRLTTDRVVAEVTVPAEYDYDSVQTVKRLSLQLASPSMDDQTDDWARLQIAFRLQHGIERISCSLPLLRSIGPALRDGDWQVSAIVEISRLADQQTSRLIALQPGHGDDYAPIWGAAIDIGTTTVSLWLVDLVTGKVRAQVAEYNGQIARGEDVISRIIYASKDGGGDEMRQRVLDTINDLLEAACKRVKLDEGRVTPDQIVKATISGNSTMIHLLLGIPASSIRLSPFVTAVNHPPTFSGRDMGLNLNPEASVDCLPGVASYVGADITAGALSSGLDDADDVTLFIDIGTNGETVLGNRDWLVTCACSAGPAFEGAGVVNGMRATQGAISALPASVSNACCTNAVGLIVSALTKLSAPSSSASISSGRSASRVTMSSCVGSGLSPVRSTCIRSIAVPPRSCRSASSKSGRSLSNALLACANVRTRAQTRQRHAASKARDQTIV